MKYKSILLCLMLLSPSLATSKTLTDDDVDVDNMTEAQYKNYLMA